MFIHSLMLPFIHSSTRRHLSPEVLRSDRGGPDAQSFQLVCQAAALKDSSLAMLKPVFSLL